MAIALVDSAVAPLSGDGGGSATTATLDSTGANLLVVVASGRGAATITDSKGNSGWTGCTSQTGADARVRIFYCIPDPAKVGSGHQFTCTNTERAQICAAAFSGAHATPLDQQNGKTDQGTGFTAGSVTPSEDNELIIQACAGYSSANGMDALSGYTELRDAVSFGGLQFGCALDYVIQTTAGATNPTWNVTFPDTGGNLCCATATFKAASSGNVSIAPPAGAVAVAGVAPVRFQAVLPSPPAGSITVTGVAPALNIGVGNTVVVMPVGAVTLAGQAPSITNSLTFTPPAGTITLTGTNVQVAFSGPDAGTVTLTGLAPTVVITVFGNPTVAVPVGAITLTGLAPVISGETLVGAGGASNDLTTALDYWLDQSGHYNNEEMLRRLKALYGGSDLTTLLAKFLHDRG